MAENTATTRNVQQQQQQQQQHPVVPRRHHHVPGVPVGTQTAQAIITGNGNTTSTASAAAATSATTTSSCNSTTITSTTNGPRTVVLQRQNNDFGFTLRHFIVYPPESCTKSGGANYLTQPMDSIFVKEVHPGTSAHFAGLLEGDRLLAVNGVPVVGTSYPHVVAMIQQTPKTLTLQVVPKNYDLIQAYFGDTAHNPETNRRQQIYGLTSAPRQAPSFDTLSERQESLYGTLQSLVQPMGNNIYSEPQAIYSRPKMKEAKATIGNVIIRAKDPTYDAIKMQQRRESGSSIASSVLSYDSKSTVTNTSDNSMGDSAIISRIRKSCEQKEEFLRRPSQPFVYNVAPAASQQQQHQNYQQQQVSPQRHPVIFENVAVPAGAVQHPQHREFYSRPNRLQKAMWPPHEQLSISPTPGQTAMSPPTSPPQQKQAQHMSIREQFFNSLQREPSPKLALEADQPEMRKELPHQNLRVVSELTKQFSSGRPLSPDGIMDRTLLYKSELSRLQQKQVHPNVALRRREFELKAETVDWRRSLDKNRSSSVDTESTEHPESRARSLSAESSHTSTTTNTTERRDEVPPIPPPRNKHSNESHISAVRSTNAFWLQGPSNLLSLPPSAIATAQSQPPLAQQTDTQSSHFYFPPTRFPFDEQQLRKMHSRELKQAHRNQTIVEVHSDVEMHSVEGLSEVVGNGINGTAAAGGERSMSLAEKCMQPMALASAPYPQFMRPTTLNLADTGVVKLRQKVNNSMNVTVVDVDDDKPMRRVSYLRATAADGGGCFHIDSDFDSSPVSLVPELEAETPETDEPPLNVKPAYRPWRRPRFTSDIEPLRKLFEESPPPVSLPPIVENVVQQQSIGGVYASVFPGRNFFYQRYPSHTTKDKALSHFRDSPADSSVPVTHDGVLRIKITVIDGKRSHDRSWRTVHAELRGYRFKLTIIRDGKASQSPEPSGIIDLTNFHLTEGNYTKRKHVFKLTTSQPVCPPGSPSITSFKPHERELLIQADNEHDMKVWMNVLRNVCRTNSAATIGTANEYITNNNLGQVAEPQTMPAVQQVQDEFSPVLSNKTQRKYTFDSRSPSGQSPVTKSRKTPMTPNAASGNSGSDKETGSPKSKTWKGIVARQFRRIGGGPGGQPQEILPPEGASFGVPLSLCPPSLENEYVPMLVARCVDIVEAKGLNVVGIYRVPGNTAAITQLTEQVNRGFDEQTLKDPRWEDVNVVSSLLKSFIRNLPEPILPNDFYHRFIAADKLAGTKRLEKLKAVLQEFPPYSYETLKTIVRHLYRVSHNCVVNLMDPRNLAIVFGPSVVRCTTGTLESDVKDMKHQCQIVEALVTHFTYFFENESLPDVTDGNHGPATETSLEVQSKNLLLDNVAKLEHSKEHSSRFVANIVQAANRKIRRTAQRKSNVSSAVSSADTLSLDSTTSAESKGQRKLSYLSDSSGHGLTKDNQGHTMLSTEVMPSSEDDSNDSAFNENVGSMSLTGVTIVLDNKLKSLRDTKIELANREKQLLSEETKENINVTKSHRPLTLGGENIPYADESPERPHIQPRIKPLRPYPFNNTEISTVTNTIPKSDESKEISSSDDTDTSTTSNPRDITANLSASTVRIEQLREMSRMLSNLEKKAHHLERKFCLNRSLSLNYKNQNNKNSECCCRNNYYSVSGGGGGGSNINNNNVRSRLSLTKDEKTDKNISKRRQLQDSAGKRRGGAKDRSIRRRHTVGGAHDYYNKTGHTVNDCDRYIVTDISSNTLKLEDEDGASDDNEYSRK